MMMNFLDFSAVSEEERRLITEILSDTSVVNFAEPLNNKKQQAKINQHQPQPQTSKQNSTTHLPELQQHQPLNYSNQTAPNASPRSNHVNRNQNSTTTQSNTHYIVPSAVPSAKALNYVKSNQPDGSINQVVETNVCNVRNASTRITNNVAATTTAVPQNISTNSSDTIHSNNIIINNSNGSSVNSIRNQAFSGHDNSAPPITHHNNLLSTLTTDSNISQTTSTLPHQATATQVPPTLAGDMNSVINMDMASTQPTGYAIPPPQPPHVSTYAPSPHHVYSGPPIFQPQPYPYHLIPYLSPFAPMPYPVMTPPNSIVSTRQVPPQSNQPSNTNMSTQHTRSHSHHNKTNKVKDTARQQQQHHHQHTPLQQQQLHQEYRTNSETTKKNVDPSNQPNNSCNDNTGLPFNAEQEPSPSDSKATTSTVTEAQFTQQSQQQDDKRANQNTSSKHANDEETIKVSSDEGFDTQSSLDVSKQSHESSLPTSDKSKSPGESNNTTVGGVKMQTTEATKVENDEKNSNSDKAIPPSASSASKSWASLFKGDRTALLGHTLNGEIENGITHESENSDDENRAQRIPSGIEITVKNSHSVGSSKEQRSQEIARRALDKMAPKLAQKINSITLKHSLPLLRPRGFINKGNGCYINSTLQALIACPPFYNLMKEIGDLRGIRRENSCTPILDSFADLFLNFPPLDASKKSKQLPSDQKMQMNYLQAEAIEPKCIYNVLGKIKSECLKGAQEDAEEFLSSVLNGLHEEMIGLSETLQSSQLNSTNQNGHLSDPEDLNGDVNNDDNLWREVGPKNRSLPIRTAPVINTPVQEIFGGSLFSIRTASKDRCGHRSPFFDLQLDISGDNVRSLQDAIKSFTATEIIQDFYCTKTKQKLDAQRRTSLDQLPPILILHLKQFVYTQDQGLRKLMKKIEYPIDFELPDSCLHDKNSDKSLRNSRTYKLLAVVYHEGKEAYKGHYLTDVYHIGSSQWIRCDDSNLKVVPLPRIENPDSSRTPYLLFYRRLNTLGPSQSNRMADDLEAGDDVGWWDCSLCTYRNSSDKFKCEICDLRRGTSTRKPRCNAHTVVAQVVKQQEQIRQQTRVKSSPKPRSSTTSIANNNDNSLPATSSNESSTLKAHRKNPGPTQSGNASDSSQSESWQEPKKKKGKLLHNSNNNNNNKSKTARKRPAPDRNGDHNDDELDSSDSDSSQATDELSRASSYQSDSESYLEGNNDSPISPNEATTSSPNHSNKTTENPFKITPLEISGNLIKYSPPTTTGRTGLIIDKKRFTQHSVTVNDVTITFTEFATRQNRYIRKKKKRREDRHRGNGNNGKNIRSSQLAPTSSSATTGTTTTTEKSEPKSSDHTASTTAGD